MIRFKTCLLMTALAALTTEPSQLRSEPSVTLESKIDIELEDRLLGEVTNLMSELRRRDVKVVGALRFMISTTDPPDFSGNVGTLNIRLAEKTENALLFANPARENSVTRQIAVVANAMETAESIAGADYVENDFQAREKLFTKPYHLAWGVNGQSTAVPDAFVFGVGYIGDDLETIELQLCAFLKGEPEVIQGNRFSAPLDPRDVSEIGQNQSVPMNATGTPEEQRRLRFDSTRASHNDPVNRHPLNPDHPTAPVTLEVSYGDDKQTIEFREGDAGNAAYLPEPAMGQSVKFVVRKKESFRDQKLGVLLRINGENSILKQRLPDSQCRIWIMKPEQQELLIDGFQIKLGERGDKKPFIVTNDDTQGRLAKFYGKNIGLISLTVFAEDTESNGSPLDTNAHKHLLAIKHAKLRSEPNLNNKYQVRESLIDSLFKQTQKRGVIVDGEVVKPGPTKAEHFRRSSGPILIATVRYYRP